MLALRYSANNKAPRAYRKQALVHILSAAEITTLEMRLEMAQVQRLARNLGEELLRGLELSAPENFPVQPADQGREVARGDLRVEAGEAVRNASWRTIAPPSSAPSV